MTDFLELETRAHLDKLVSDGIEESLTLEYKASPALSKQGKGPDEMCKDVSALANSAGGQIVYGIPEKDHKPLPVDGGSDVGREWMEQILVSRVHPRMNFTIKPIDITPGKFGYVVTVPQSSTAHQAPDNKYYKRYNFMAVPMDDYEVRDAMRRATTPALRLDMSIGDRNRPMFVSWDEGWHRSAPIQLKVFLHNDSTQPAFYTMVRIFIDEGLAIQSAGGSQDGGKIAINASTNCQIFVKRIVAPPDMPVMKEIPTQVFDPVFIFHIPISHRGQPVIFTIGYDVTTPGQSFREFGHLWLQPNSTLSLDWSS